MSLELLKVDFGVDLIDVIADEVIRSGEDNFSSICVVFPGRRPSHFLFKKIGEKMGLSYYPPLVFSIEDFVKFLFEKKGKSGKVVSVLDQVWMIYKICERHKKKLKLPDKFFREGLASFINWGLEFVEVIEELDKELVSDDGVKMLKDYLSSGEVRGLEGFLSNLGLVRKEFHRCMSERGKFSIPYMYHELCVSGIPDVDFSVILFAGFYSLTHSEVELIKKLGNIADVKLYFQIDEDRRWRVLPEVLKRFNLELRPLKRSEKGVKSKLNLYKAQDVQGEVLHLYSVIKDLNEEEMDNTVVVLPKSETLIPAVVDALSRREKEKDKKFKFNVSMGYPSIRTQLYSLFDDVLKLHESKEGSLYRVKDYLKLLEHPYITGVEFNTVQFFTRKLLNSIRDFISKRLYLFFEFDRFEEEFFQSDQFKKLVDNIGIDKEKAKSHLREIHHIFIKRFEGIETLRELSRAFKDLTFYIMNNSKIKFYPLAPDFVDKYIEVFDEIEHLAFSDEIFRFEFLSRILRREMARRRLSLPGLPLEGMQVLGLLETRTLLFKRVIMLDVNEGVIPGVRKYEPVLNPLYRRALGLRERPHKTEEEIYRYHFFRLIKGADEVHLIYTEAPGKTRSRFIEEIVWEREKDEEKVIEDESEVIKSFKVYISKFPQRKKKEIPKSEEVITIVKTMKFTPTAIDDYIRCPLIFYFGHVLCLSHKDRYTGEISRAELGEAIHKVARDVLDPYIDKEITSEVFKNNFNEEMNKYLPYANVPSEHRIMVKIIGDNLKKWLEEDAKSFKKMKILFLEKKVQSAIEVIDKKITLKGRIDRIDEVETERGERWLRIIDYKTGSIENVFKPHRKEKELKIETIYKMITEKGYSIQIPLYMLMVYKKPPSIMEKVEKLEKYNSICGMIFALRRKPDRNPSQALSLAISDKSTMKVYEGVVKALLSEILDESYPFISTDDESRCERCRYSLMCINIKNKERSFES